MGQTRLQEGEELLKLVEHGLDVLAHRCQSSATSQSLSELKNEIRMTDGTEISLDMAATAARLDEILRKAGDLEAMKSAHSTLIVLTKIHSYASQQETKGHSVDNESCRDYRAFQNSLITTLHEDIFANCSSKLGLISDHFSAQIQPQNNTDKVEEITVRCIELEIDAGLAGRARDTSNLIDSLIARSRKNVETLYAITPVLLPSRTEQKMYGPEPLTPAA